MHVVRTGSGRTTSYVPLGFDQASSGIVTWNSLWSVAMKNERGAAPSALGAGGAIVTDSAWIGTSEGARIVANSPWPSPGRFSLHTVSVLPSVMAAAFGALPPVALRSRASG